VGYFLALAIPALLAGCVEMFSQPNRFYQAQGAMCAAALGIVLAWPIVAWLTAKDGAAGYGTTSDGMLQKLP
jgi:DNA-binding transcriptional regulator of glucitol operon